MSSVPVGRFLATYIDGEKITVSTIGRESSALEGPSAYFETMAFKEERIVWQSAAGFRREAVRQHALAVRWFSRPWRSGDEEGKP